MNGFPPAHCRVVTSRVSGNHAYVLLNTGTRNQPYLYGVNCVRESGRWFDAGSSNGPGWTGPEEAPEMGTLSFWGDAPESADAVRVAFQGGLIEESVIDGAFLIVWWQVPCPFDGPSVVAFRVRGVWNPQT